MSSLTITIQGWEQFNPRKDRANHTWFRTENTVMYSEALHKLDAAQKWFWICLLAFASKKHSATIDFDEEYFEEHAGVPRKKMMAALRRLESKGAISILDRGAVTSQPGYHPVTTSLTTYERTNVRTYETNTSEKVPAAPFDFEKLYESFPRKEGKAAGMRGLSAQILTIDDFADFERACFHYGALITRRGTEPKFVKLWSTFVGAARSGFPWREFIDRPSELDAPSASAQGSESADQIAARLIDQHEQRIRQQEESA